MGFMFSISVTILTKLVPSTACDVKTWKVSTLSSLSADSTSERWHFFLTVSAVLEQAGVVLQFCFVIPSTLEQLCF